MTVEKLGKKELRYAAKLAEVLGDLAEALGQLEPRLRDAELALAAAKEVEVVASSPFVDYQRLLGAAEGLAERLRRDLDALVELAETVREKLKALEKRHYAKEPQLVMVMRALRAGCRRAREVVRYLEGEGCFMSVSTAEQLLRRLERMGWVVRAGEGEYVTVEDAVKREMRGGGEP
jgi:predicted  nucleic acid-binding Zn-ribbon protein